MSDVRFLFKPTIIWKQKQALKNPLYGLSLKVYKIEVIQAETP